MTRRYTVLLLVLIILSVAPLYVLRAWSRATGDPGVAWHFLRFIQLQMFIWGLLGITVIYGVAMKIGGMVKNKEGEGEKDTPDEEHTAARSQFK